jgi:heptaprenyl diphosphate synthase
MNPAPKPTESVPDVPVQYLISFFAALCMFLSAVEYAIPKPLPFLRIGLANLPVILSLAKMRRRDTLLLIVLKVLGQGFISGTFFSYIFVFSAGGSFASGLAMIGLYSLPGRTRLFSCIGLSLAGALANNAVQIVLARCILFGPNTRYIAPVLLVSGLVTGFALGMFANLFVAQSKWYASLPDIRKAEERA